MQQALTFTLLASTTAGGNRERPTSPEADGLPFEAVLAETAAPDAGETESAPTRFMRGAVKFPEDPDIQTESDQVESEQLQGLDETIASFELPSSVPSDNGIVVSDDGTVVSDPAGSKDAAMLRTSSIELDAAPPQNAVTSEVAPGTSSHVESPPIPKASESAIPVHAFTSPERASASDTKSTERPPASPVGAQFETRLISEADQGVQVPNLAKLDTADGSPTPVSTDAVVTHAASENVTRSSTRAVPTSDVSLGTTGQRPDAPKVENRSGPVEPVGPSSPTAVVSVEMSSDPTEDVPPALRRNEVREPVPQTVVSRADPEPRQGPEPQVRNRLPEATVSASAPAPTMASHSPTQIQRTSTFDGEDVFARLPGAKEGDAVWNKEPIGASPNPVTGTRPSFEVQVETLPRTDRSVEADFHRREITDPVVSKADGLDATPATERSRTRRDTFGENSNLFAAQAQGDRRLENSHQPQPLSEDVEAPTAELSTRIRKLDGTDLQAIEKTQFPGAPVEPRSLREYAYSARDMWNRETSSDLRRTAETPAIDVTTNPAYSAASHVGAVPPSGVLSVFDVQADEVLVDGVESREDIQRDRSVSQSLRASETTPTDTQGKNVARSVASALAERVANATSGNLEVRLSPEELGRLRITFTQAEAGLTVVIQADRPETLDLLRRNAEQFSEDLRSAGYEDVTMSFGNDQEQTGAQQGWGQEAHSQSALESDTIRDGAKPIPDPGQAAAQAGLDLRL